MKTPTIRAALLVVVLAAGFAACKPHDDKMGPAQKAGQAVDNVGDKVAHDLQEQLERARQAGQQIADSAEETKNRIEQASADAGKGLNKATEEVGKKVERAGEKIQEASKK